MESGENLGLESAKGMELTSAEEMGIKTKKDAAVAPCAGGAALVVLLAVVILAVAKKRKSGKK